MSDTPQEARRTRSRTASDCPATASSGPPRPRRSRRRRRPVVPDARDASPKGTNRWRLRAHHEPPKLMAKVAKIPRGAPAVKCRSGTSVGCAPVLEVGGVVVFAEAIATSQEVRRREAELEARPRERPREVRGEDVVAALAEGKGARPDVGDAEAERPASPGRFRVARQVGDERGVRADDDVGHVRDEEMRVVVRRAHEREVRGLVEERAGERAARRPSPLRVVPTPRTLRPAVSLKMRSLSTWVWKKIERATSHESCRRRRAYDDAAFVGRDARRTAS